MCHDSLSDVMGTHTGCDSLRGGRTEEGSKKDKLFHHHLFFFFHHHTITPAMRVQLVQQPRKHFPIPLVYLVAPRSVPCLDKGPLCLSFLKARLPRASTLPCVRPAQRHSGAAKHRLTPLSDHPKRLLLLHSVPLQSLFLYPSQNRLRALRLSPLVSALATLA